MRARRLVLVPGVGGSDEGHWHHEWARGDDRCTWVTQADWHGGTRDGWVDTVEAEIQRSSVPTVLVAHSTGAVVVAHWVARASTTDGAALPIGALLVAPADVEADWAEPGSFYRRFAPIPLTPLPFPAIIVASTDDPYLSVDRADELGAAWGADVEVVGAHGHLGADADLGDWPEGRALLNRLLS